MNTIKDQIKKSYKFQKELPKPLILEKTGPHPHRALRNPNQKMRKIKPPFPIILNYSNYPPSKKKQNKKKTKTGFHSISADETLRNSEILSNLLSLC